MVAKGTHCPMPPQNRQKIHDRLLVMRFMPGKPYTLEQMAAAVDDLWPGVTANHVRGAIAGLASKEKAIRARFGLRSFRESPQVAESE